ncbi:type II CAAX endopeptidase family protein [Halococcus sp. PRR34]|uniref:CPBP family intramembrane glutamic endopeptidase n=1 Tax=Halococcus sp. PRR34 TaxID=3020830 RepID=UPI00235EE29E|nr:type II CAAX endopeptidase family protein [Halococcus sp. PRR34]
MSTTVGMDGTWGRLRAVGVGAAITVAGFLAAVPFGFVVGNAAGLLGIEFSLTAGFVLSTILLQGVAFPLTAFGYLRLRGLSLSFVKARLPTLRDLLWIVSGYVLVFALVFALLLIVVNLGVPTASRTDQAALQDPGTLIWLVPLSLLVIGPGEELLFRGIIQGRLRESFGPVGAIILASATFAPAHILALTGSPQALAATISLLFVPALVFGVTYELTDNLVVPSIIHGAYNATIFGIVYIGLRYGPTQPPGLL